MVLGVTDTGNGPAVLLLHGVGGDRRTWDAQVEALRGDHRVLAVDLPGHGDGPREAMERPALVEWLWDLLTERGVEAATIVGSDLGAVLAVEMAFQSPRRVHALVLANAFADHPARDVLMDRAEVGTRNGMRPYVEARVDGLLLPDAPEATRRRVVESFSAMDRDAYLHANRLCWSASLGAELPLLRCPTLVVAGHLDPVTPLPLAEELAAGIPGARLQVLPTAHLSHLDDPDAFNGVLQRFLTTVEAQAAAHRP